MSKKMKWLLGIMLVGAFAVLATTFWIVDKLPGPTEMALKMDHSADKAPHETHDIGVEEKSETKTVAAAETTKTPTDTKSQEDNKQMLLALLNENPADIRVCDNLGAGPKNKKELLEADISDLFKSSARENPVIEAMRIPIKAIFQDEQVSSLLNDVMKVDTSKMDKAEKDSLLTKLGFYGRAAATAAHMIGRKRDFEVLGDRAIHLSVISRIAALKPELATDPRIREACENMERSIIQEEKVSLKKERKEILALIKEAGLTPEDLNFDPEAFIKFHMKFNDNGLHFSLSDKEPST